MIFNKVSVSVSVTLRKNYWSDLRGIFTGDVFVDKKESIKFRKSTASAFGSRNFERILQHYKIVKIRHFPQLLGSYHRCIGYLDKEVRIKI